MNIKKIIILIIYFWKLQLKSKAHIKLSFTNHEINQVISDSFNTIKLGLFKSGIAIHSEITRNPISLEYIDNNKFLIKINFLYLKAEKFIIGENIGIIRKVGNFFKGVGKGIKNGFKKIGRGIKNGFKGLFGLNNKNNDSNNDIKKKKIHKPRKKEKETYEVEKSNEEYTIKQIEDFYKDSKRPKKTLFLYNCLKKQKNKYLKIYFTRIKKSTTFKFKKIVFNYKCIKSVYLKLFNLNNKFVFWFTDKLYKMLKKFISNLVMKFLIKQYNIKNNNLINSYSIKLQKFDIEKLNPDNKSYNDDKFSNNNDASFNEKKKKFSINIHLNVLKRLKN